MAPSPLTPLINQPKSRGGQFQRAKEDRVALGVEMNGPIVPEFSFTSSGSRWSSTLNHKSKIQRMAPLGLPEIESVVISSISLTQRRQTRDIRG